MSDINQVVLIGRLGQMPEIKQSQNGSTMARFSLAVNRAWNKDGQKQEECSWVPCQAFGRTADLIYQYCQKGKQIAVKGRLRQHTWEKDGEKRSMLMVIVEQMQLLQSSQGNGNGYSHEGSPGPLGSGQDARYQDNAPEMIEFPEDDIPF